MDNEDHPVHLDRSTTLGLLQQSLAQIIAALSHRATIDDIARRCGRTLTPTSWNMLTHLDVRGPLRVSELAACHAIDVSSITPRLKRLEAEGLVEREKDARDARVSLIHLTDAGSRALSDFHAAYREVLDQALVDLGLEERAAIAGALAMLSSRLALVTDVGVRN